MNRNEQMDQLAKAAVERGVCVKPGQTVVIRGQYEMIEMIRKVAEEAWKAGAKDVCVVCGDPVLDRLQYTHASDEDLANPPAWMIDRLQQQADEKAAFISLVGEDPDAMKGIDPDRILRRSLAMRTKADRYRAGIDNGTLAWTVIPVPTVAWAKKVFPDLEDDQAMDRMWDDMIQICRAEGDVDRNWDEHTKDLQRKCEKLNGRNFRKFHLTSSNGTDLWVDMPEGAQFCGGATQLEDGRFINCNMPTEELFSAPSRTGVNGTLEAVLPLSWNGQMINGFGFTFKDGEVVDYHADEGYESLGALLDSDPNGRRLGEIAFVDKKTPIRQMGRIYFNTLIDENAACHFAFGQSYGETMKGAQGMSSEELEVKGMNQSAIHVDFMVGAEDLNIDGITADGTSVPVFRDGSFTAEFSGE